MTKPQWEEDWDVRSESLITHDGLRVIDPETHKWELDPIAIKDFIRSLVEKTRSEVAESAAEAVANAYKYGLERAINLIPGEYKEKAISDADGYPDGWDKCREESIKNIKNELKK